MLRDGMPLDELGEMMGMGWAVATWLREMYRICPDNIYSHEAASMTNPWRVHLPGGETKTYATPEEAIKELEVTDGK